MTHLLMCVLCMRHKHTQMTHWLINIAIHSKVQPFKYLLPVYLAKHL
jgi:hypothetical protein